MFPNSFLWVIMITIIFLSFFESNVNFIMVAGFNRIDSVRHCFIILLLLLSNRIMISKPNCQQKAILFQLYDFLAWGKKPFFFVDLGLRNGLLFYFFRVYVSDQVLILLLFSFFRVLTVSIGILRLQGLTQGNVGTGCREAVSI